MVLPLRFRLFTEEVPVQGVVGGLGREGTCSGGFGVTETYRSKDSLL